VIIVRLYEPGKGQIKARARFKTVEGGRNCVVKGAAPIKSVLVVKNM